MAAREHIKILEYNLAGVLNWKSSDDNVASVDRGVLDAKGTGTVEITAYKDCSNTEWIKKFDVTVVQAPTGGGTDTEAALPKEVEEAIKEAEKKEKVTLEVKAEEAVSLGEKSY